jgi:rRNA processing protein Krr1/Pno1
MDVSRGMAIAANMKVLNDSVQVEINAAKMALATEGKAHSFGRIVGMGQRLIGNDGSQAA